MTAPETRLMLKPCPFCGGKASIVLGMKQTVRTADVMCDDCGGAMPAFCEDDAVNDWNTRATEPARSPPGSGGAESLIQKWRKEARNFRTVAKEMYDHGDDEEGTLCNIEADRLDTCANELADLAHPRPDRRPICWGESVMECPRCEGFSSICLECRLEIEDCDCGKDSKPWRCEECHGRGFVEPQTEMFPEICTYPSCSEDCPGRQSGKIAA